MITKEDFIHIKEEVDSAIKQAFEFAKENENNENDYILFLGNAEYVEKYEGSINPYVVDYRINGYHDQDRLSFLVDYLNDSYSFKTEQTKDTKTSISLELMIYTHLWESKPFLRLLKKLVNLCDSSEYNWKVEIPDFTKHTFIRQELRDKLNDQDLELGNILTNGYHSSLRNAFAHSEFVFSMNNDEIILTNYNGGDWELRSINYNDWTRRFCYSFLLSYSFQEFFEKEREKLVEGDPGYTVTLKRRDGTDMAGIMKYKREGNNFTARAR